MIGALVAVAGYAAVLTRQFRDDASEAAREIASLCDVAERNRWVPAELERAECADRVSRGLVDSSAAAMGRNELHSVAGAVARSLQPATVSRWRDELAAGRAAKVISMRLATRPLRDAVCAPHDPAFLGGSPVEHASALVALLAEVSRDAPDDCLRGAVDVVQLAQRMAHGTSSASYTAAAEVIELGASTLVRCSRDASGPARARTADELRALSRSHPPWIAPAIWQDYVIATQAEDVLAASVARGEIVWPWSRTGSSGASRSRSLPTEWATEQLALVRTYARRTRAACEATSRAAVAARIELSHQATAMREVHDQTSACLAALSSVFTMPFSELAEQEEPAAICARSR